MQRIPRVRSRFLPARAALAGAVAAGLFAMTACDATLMKLPPAARPIQPQAAVTISGTVTYRERMLPPPGARVTVTLEDISLADAPSVELARWTREVAGQGVPFTYQLEVAAGTLLPGRRYSVRAVIRDGRDALLWTSDTVAPVDATSARQVLPPIMMVRTQR